jgi:hypothetical protein
MQEKVMGSVFIANALPIFFVLSPCCSILYWNDLNLMANYTCVGKPVVPYYTGMTDCLNLDS